MSWANSQYVFQYVNLSVISFTKFFPIVTNIRKI